ncbi:hypothetical protein MTO96_014173 [Rhipicephalus appendiculatus]
MASQDSSASSEPSNIVSTVVCGCPRTRPRSGMVRVGAVGDQRVIRGPCGSTMLVALWPGPSAAASKCGTLWVGVGLPIHGSAELSHGSWSTKFPVIGTRSEDLFRGCATNTTEVVPDQCVFRGRPDSSRDMMWTKVTVLLLLCAAVIGREHQDLFIGCEENPGNRRLAVAPC